MSNLHIGWSKIKLHTIVAEIAQKKMAKKYKETHYSVTIKNEGIFKELGHAFKNIVGYKKLYIRLFEDMSKFEFDKTSSVTDNDSGVGSIYKTIKLDKHTINTFNAMTDLIKDDKNFLVQKDIYLLIALLHDFGKSHSLCEHYGISLEDDHCERSSYYFTFIVKNILNNDYDFEMDNTTFEIIRNTLFIHHSLHTKQDKENRYLIALIKADGLARKKEKNEMDTKI